MLVIQLIFTVGHDRTAMSNGAIACVLPNSVVHTKTYRVSYRNSFRRKPKIISLSQCAEVNELESNERKSIILEITTQVLNIKRKWKMNENKDEFHAPKKTCVLRMWYFLLEPSHASFIQNSDINQNSKCVKIVTSPQRIYNHMWLFSSALL